MNKLASQIDSLNKHLIGSLHTSYPFGLAHGKMDYSSIYTICMIIRKKLFIKRRLSDCWTISWKTISLKTQNSPWRKVYAGVALGLD